MSVNTSSNATTHRKLEHGFDELQELQAKYVRTLHIISLIVFPLGLSNFVIVGYLQLRRKMSLFKPCHPERVKRQFQCALLAIDSKRPNKWIIQVKFKRVCQDRVT